MIKVLLTGASGTLVSSILENSDKSKYEFINIDKLNSSHVHSLGDLSDFIFLYKSTNEYEPDAIFHFAAETNVDLCETDKIKSINDNYISTKHVVDFASKNNIPVVFIRTDSIFSGKTEYNNVEKDIPDPKNFYALTKLFSEDYIKRNINNYIIIRLGWLIGNPDIDKKFIGTILRFIKERKNKIFSVEDLYGSISFADKLSPVIYHLLENKNWGVYHFSSFGIASRYDIIRKILDVYKLSQNISLTAVKNEYFNQIAKRPKYELLSNSK